MAEPTRKQVEQYRQMQRERKMAKIQTLTGIGAIILLSAGLIISNYGARQTKKRIDAEEKAKQEQKQKEAQEDRELEQKREETHKLQILEAKIKAGAWLGDEPVRYTLPENYGKNVRTNSQPTNQLNPSSRANPTNHVSKNIENLMSDEFFRNSKYLTKDEIRGLLVNYDSCLTNLNGDEKIASAAERYSINPVVLISRLQVEQGLLTKSKASRNALKYAAGYGAMDNGRILKSSGLDEQIENMASNLNDHYNAFSGQTVKIDNETKEVQPENAATYAILRYTPHTYAARLNSEVITNYVLPAVDATNSEAR